MCDVFAQFFQITMITTVLHINNFVFFVQKQTQQSS